MEIVVSRRAEKDVLDAWNYYESRSAGLGDQFTEDVYATMDRIAANPQYYSYIKPGKEFRDLALRIFPYVVVYKILDDSQVFIISVHNTYKKPISL